MPKTVQELINDLQSLVNSGEVSPDTIVLRPSDNFYGGFWDVDDPEVTRVSKTEDVLEHEEDAPEDTVVVL